MIGKSYFVFISIFILFTNYYQWVVDPFYGLMDYLALFRDCVLVLVGMRYFFSVRLFKERYWLYAWWFLVFHLLLSGVLQILPTSYFGNLMEGQIFVNIFTFFLALFLLLPLYISAFSLSIQTKSKLTHNR